MFLINYFSKTLVVNEKFCMIKISFVGFSGVVLICTYCTECLVEWY